MTDLKKFIEKNNLLFTDGRRNKDMLTLVGYALFKKCSKASIERALEEQFKANKRTQDEFKRVFQYAKDNNYGSWWNGVEVVDELIIK